MNRLVVLGAKCLYAKRAPVRAFKALLLAAWAFVSGGWYSHPSSSFSLAITLTLGRPYSLTWVLGGSMKLHSTTHYSTRSTHCGPPRDTCSKGSLTAAEGDAMLKWSKDRAACSWAFFSGRISMWALVNSYRRVMFWLFLLAQAIRELYLFRRQQSGNLRLGRPAFHILLTEFHTGKQSRVRRVQSNWKTKLLELCLRMYPCEGWDWSL